MDSYFLGTCGKPFTSMVGRVYSYGKLHACSAFHWRYSCIHNCGIPRKAIFSCELWLLRHLRARQQSLRSPSVSVSVSDSSSVSALSVLIALTPQCWDSAVWIHDRSRTKSITLLNFNVILALVYFVWQNSHDSDSSVLVCLRFADYSAVDEPRLRIDVDLPVYSDGNVVFAVTVLGLSSMTLLNDQPKVWIK